MSNWPNFNPEPNLLQWFKLSKRHTEMLLWQMIQDHGGEVSIQPPDDKPGRSVMFYYDEDASHIGMIANEE